MTALLAKSDTTASITVASNGEAFACDPGRTLLLAGLAAGLDLPYECASGACGSCRCKLVSGEVDCLWPDAPGLSQRDRRRGNMVLMCQSVPRSDCTIEVRVRGDLAVPRPNRRGGRIEAVRLLTQSMVELVVVPDMPMPFLPGQFVMVALPGIGRRAYSMANVSDGGKRLALIVKLKDGGTVSPRLCRSLIAGDRITVEGPYGGAWFRQHGSRPVIGIAGGSGLAPIWSIAQAAARQGRRDVHLYFGVNACEDICFADEFGALRALNPRLRIEMVVVDPACIDAGYRTGLVGDAVLADLPDLTGADVYMAGPPAMIDAIMQRLVGEGRVDCDHVFFDRFC